MIPGLSIEVWLAFLAACVVLAATPGPSMSLFMANATSYGVKAGLLSVAGNTIGLSVLIVIATLGLTSIMAIVAQWFEVIRWIGVAYLVFLGLQKLHSAVHPNAVQMRAAPSARQILPQATFVALSNPKVLLFLGAFFPQFLDPTHPVGPQLTILAVSFVSVIVLTDASLVLAASRARVLLTRQGTRLADAVSGTILLGGGALLAAIRR